jgi:hypothetical protein
MRVPEHNHDLLLWKPPNIPKDITETAIELLNVRIEKQRIADFLDVRTGCLFSRLQWAALHLEDIRPDLGTNTDNLLEYIPDQRDYVRFELPVDGEPKRVAILPITAEDYHNVGRFGDVVFLDGMGVSNPLGRTTYPITLVDNEKAVCTGSCFWRLMSRTECSGGCPRTCGRLSDPFCERC